MPLFYLSKPRRCDTDAARWDSAELIVSFTPVLFWLRRAKMPKTLLLSRLRYFLLCLLTQKEAGKRAMDNYVTKPDEK